MKTTFEVYHAIDPSFPLINERLFAEARKFPTGYTKVAEVECETMGEVFMLTNNIEHSWTENPEVVTDVESARSTSVGDIVMFKDNDGTLWAYICAPIGWECVTDIVQGEK